jgi:hypothetical protein
MTSGCVLQSLYAQLSVVPIDREQAPLPKPVASKPRSRDNFKQSHATSLGSSRISSIPAEKRHYVSSNQVHARFLGHDQGAPVRKDFVAAGNPTMHAQNRYIPLNPPISVHCEADYEPPMSQLSYAEDWSGAGSVVSQSAKPHWQYSQSDSKSTLSRVHPFNMHRSATISSCNASIPQKNSNQTTASSNCASFQPFPQGQRHPVTPAPPAALVPFNYSTGSLKKTVSSNAQSHGYHHSSKTLFDSKSLSANSYHCVHQDSSQSSTSGSGLHYPGLAIPDLTSEELLDRRIKAILKEAFQAEKKEFDENQRFLYRRISEAEDNQADYIREIDQKHQECMNQIKEIGKKVSSFNGQVTDASNAHAKRFVELDEKAKELESSACRIDEMHHKVVGMFKSVEDLVEKTMAAVLGPHLKQKIIDMATTVAKDLGLNSQSPATEASTASLTDISKTSNNIKSSEGNHSFVVTKSQDLSNTGTKSKPKREVTMAHKSCKSTPDVIQLSQVFSPFAAPMSRAPVPRVPKPLTSPAIVTRSCVTPCPKERRNFTGHVVFDTCTPVKKRTMTTKNFHAKRQRSRFGNIRSLHIDSEESYAFLSS